MAKIALVSLGCAKNQVDGEVMLGRLEKAGHELVAEPAEADVVIVNTCGFIEAAKEESINTILELAQLKKRGLKGLVVAGCLAQRYAEELRQEMPEIDALLGTGDLDLVEEAVARVLAGDRPQLVGKGSYRLEGVAERVLLNPPHYAYLKIAEGCDNRCSYCAIPMIRGPYRSRPLPDLVAEARLLAEKGVKELILVAQDTTRYGLDLYGRRMLVDLLEALHQVEGLAWIRLLYLYPTHLDEELIAAIGRLPRVCPYFDIPLQHVNDEILRWMNRPITGKQIKSLLAKIREMVPDAVLRTSLIVGFPGETEEQFRELMDFVAAVEFDRLGVFTYSQEENTPAAAMTPQVPEEVKEERYHRLMSLQQEISRRKNRAKVGKELEVMIDGPAEGEEGLFAGRTRGDAPEVDGLVLVRGENLAPGDLVQVRVTHAFEYDLMGELLR
ncbi:MAG: ribosomal protein methylthiotransferase [Eubacteriales bacterium]|nr:ribosomal protein methylthiotransferase [Eubacteriales bacterium]